MLDIAGKVMVLKVRKTGTCRGGRKEGNVFI